MPTTFSVYCKKFLEYFFSNSTSTRKEDATHDEEVNAALLEQYSCEPFEQYYTIKEYNLEEHYGYDSDDCKHCRQMLLRVPDLSRLTTAMEPYFNDAGDCDYVILPDCDDKTHYKIVMSKIFDWLFKHVEPFEVNEDASEDMFWTLVSANCGTILTNSGTILTDFADIFENKVEHETDRASFDMLARMWNSDPEEFQQFLDTEKHG
jgi:hypothetical protein